jgi:hypothetical protein
MRTCVNKKKIFTVIFVPSVSSSSSFPDLYFRITVERGACDELSRIVPTALDISINARSVLGTARSTVGCNIYGTMLSEYLGTKTKRKTLTKLKYRILTIPLHPRFPSPHAEVSVSPSMKRLGLRALISIFGVSPAIISARLSPMGGDSLKQ